MARSESAAETLGVSSTVARAAAKKSARVITGSIVANIVYFSQKGKENGSFLKAKSGVQTHTCE